MGNSDRPSHVVIREAEFAIGQLVHHKLFGYRGVIVEVDAQFSGSPVWYEHVARSRPSKAKPWYHVLPHDTSHQTYVAEQNLESDDTNAPIEHPLVALFFDRFADGHYERTRNLN